MSSTRISSNYQTNQAVFYLQGHLKKLTDLQLQVSSGKNIHRPSDDPVGFNRLLEIDSARNADERYTRNIGDAKAELDMADGAIKSVVDLINRAKEITLQAAQDTTNQDNRNAIALEITNIVDQLIQVGNTQIAGKFIFGGMNTTGIVPPAVTSAPIFARTGANTVTYSGTGTATNPTFQRRVEIAEGITIPVNVNGLSVFGEVQPNGAPPPATTGSGIIRTLTELVNNLQAGTTTDIQARLDDIDSDLTNVLNIQASIGAVSSQLELTANRMEDRKLAFEEQFANIQGVDVAKALSDLNFQQTAYQASLGVAARVLQTSLLNYLS
jgi:flagellar hook-associated protein 3 FlgL